MNTGEKYDALVVGAGPAGMAAARTLAEQGARVVLIDKHRAVGHKACAGGLTASGVERASIDPDALPVHARGFHSLTVHSSRWQSELRAESMLLVTIDRPSWTHSQLETLSGLGVDLRLGVRLNRFDGTRVSTSHGPVTADHLIGADGASSRVRRLLGLPRDHWATGWQIRLDPDLARERGIDLNRPSVWFAPHLFGAGYGWAFPGSDALRLGCGASSRSVGMAELKRSFFTWLTRFNLGSGDGRLEVGTIGCQYSGHRFGRVFLAGDAAGLASPLTGEGIAQALISGREVAREMVDPHYRSALIPELAARHRRTEEVLEQKGLGHVLYELAPLLLRWPALRRTTLNRYMA